MCKEKLGFQGSARHFFSKKLSFNSSCWFSSRQHFFVILIIKNFADFFIKVNGFPKIV